MFDLFDRCLKAKVLHKEWQKNRLALEKPQSVLVFVKNVFNKKENTTYFLLIPTFLSRKLKETPN